MADPGFYYLEVMVDEFGTLSYLQDNVVIYIDDNYKQQYIGHCGYDDWSTLMWNCGASKKGMDLTTPSNDKLKPIRFMKFKDIGSVNAHAGTNYPKCPLDPN